MPFCVLKTRIQELQLAVLLFHEILDIFPIGLGFFFPLNLHNHSNFLILTYGSATSSYSNISGFIGSSSFFSSSYFAPFCYLLGLASSNFGNFLLFFLRIRFESSDTSSLSLSLETLAISSSDAFSFLILLHFSTISIEMYPWDEVSSYLFVSGDESVEEGVCL